MAVDKALMDHKGKLKKPAKLKVSLSAGSPKQVKWFKNGEEIDTSNIKYRVSNQMPTYSLEIPELAVEDDAEYSCEMDGVEVGRGRITVDG